MPLISRDADVDLGLERAAELLVEDRQPQRLLQFHARQCLALHADVEEYRGALALVLDAIHRDVGVLAQRVVAAAMLGIQADADRGRCEHFGAVDEERRPQPLQQELDVFGDLLLALDRIEQQQKFVAADPRQHVAFAQIEPEPPRDLDQQRVADGVAVIVVDVLEIVDVEEGQRKWFDVVVMQQVVDMPFDHPPRRQPGQFVIIGAAEQLVLDGLLLADVGGTGQQQFCVGDANRPVRRQGMSA